MLALVNDHAPFLVRKESIDLFWQIAGFILLVLFASAAVGGIQILRRMGAVVALRAKLEGVKTKRLIAEVEHALRIEDHKYGQQVLALTVGDRKEGDVEAPPEHVKGEVQPEPYNGKELTETYRLRNKAVDGEFTASGGGRD